MKIDSAVAVLGLLGALSPCLRAQTLSPLEVLGQAAGELFLIYTVLLYHSAYTVCYVYLCQWINETLGFGVALSHTANWTGTLPCGGWDCECVFNKPKGCCCVTAPLFQLEEATIMHLVDLWKNLQSLNNHIEEVIGNTVVLTNSLSAFIYYKSTCVFLLIVLF